ncbi:putative integrase/recombinase HI_1572 [Gammaproteobacteria bacterium]
MATIEKRGARWRVRVRKDGVDLSESFRLKSEAQAWASQREADISAGKLGRAVDKTFGDLLRRYRDDVSVSKDGAEWEQARINRLIGAPAHNIPRQPDPLSLVRLPNLGPEHFAAWRDRRMAEVTAATVLREWNLLSAACSKAVKEWRWLPRSPLTGVKLPSPPPPPRTRRISQDEIDRIIVCCGYSPGDRLEAMQARVGAAFLFAIETAMRAGEICALRWGDVDIEHRVAHVRAIEKGARKTKTSRIVPLSLEAIRIIEQLRGVDPDKVFMIQSSLLDALFRKAKKRAMVDDLHFHDSRAEALTRLSKKLDIMQLARMSGHKDLKILFEVYYREKMEDIAHRLD